jgi:hypothetical protein
MELVKGIPITRFCDQEHLSPRERLELFIPVCQAVQHAHQKGIIHRDLKPSNVLIALYDGKAVPKVIDFGVAKATAQKLTERTMFTEVGQIVGTLEYMAPEQAELNNLDIDTRADVYSLGVLLYELLTGSPPFTAKQLRTAAFDEMLRIIREVEPPRPSTKLSGSEELPAIAAKRRLEPAKLARLLRGELDWIVMKCLEKERGRRYETANGLAQDVLRYLADEAVEARPPSAGYRLGKLLRRHRGPVTAAAALVAALLAGIAGTSWGLLRAEQRRAEADVARAEEARQRVLAQEKEQEAQQEKEKAVKAAQAESAALAQTHRRLAQIEKGVEQLASLLTGLDPRSEEKGGPPLFAQLRERVSKAADQLDGESVGDPVAVARLQGILGSTLREMGDFAKASAVLEKACATLERELGEYHPDSLEARNKLAGAYWADGKSELAIPIFERVVKVRQAKLGEDHLDTLTSCGDLAVVYHAAGKLELAIPLFERTLKGQETKLGEDHPLTLSNRQNLAIAYQDAAKLELAIPLLERTLKALEAKLGENHFETLTCRNSLAVAYYHAGKSALALPLFERTLKAQEAKLGQDHPDTLITRGNLARTYQDTGKPEQAVLLLERTLKALQAKLDADHPHLLTTSGNLARAYRAAGKLDLAIPLFEVTLKGRRAKLGEDHPDTLTSFNNLAEAYQDAGKRELAQPLFERSALGVEKLHFQHRYAESIIGDLASAYEGAKQFDKAESWRRKWLAFIKEKSGADSMAYAREMTVLGSNLLQQKKWKDGESILRDSLAIQEKMAPDDWAAFDTKSMLGAAVLGQKKYADAEPLLIAGFEGMQQREKQIPVQSKIRLTQALERLVELCEAFGGKSDADKWRRELEQRKAAEKPRGKS